MIRERKESAQRNINALLTRELTLGSFLPFSMHDGGNPFLVFIFRSGLNVKCKAFVPAYMLKKERGLSGQSKRVFL